MSPHRVQSELCRPDSWKGVPHRVQLSRLRCSTWGIVIRRGPEVWNDTSKYPDHGSKSALTSAAHSVHQHFLSGAIFGNVACRSPTYCAGCAGLFRAAACPAVTHAWWPGRVSRNCMRSLSRCNRPRARPQRPAAESHWSQREDAIISNS